MSASADLPLPWVLTAKEQKLIDRFNKKKYVKWAVYGWTLKMRDDMAAVLTKHRKRMGLRTEPFSGNRMPDLETFPVIRPVGSEESFRFRTWLHDMQGGLCAACGWPVRLRDAANDHIVPWKRGGTHHPCNIQLLCKACNSTKGSRSQLYLMRRLVQLELLPESEAKPAIVKADLKQRGFDIRLAYEGEV